MACMRAPRCQPAFFVLHTNNGHTLCPLKYVPRSTPPTPHTHMVLQVYQPQYLPFAASYFASSRDFCRGLRYWGMHAKVATAAAAALNPRANSFKLSGERGGGLGCMDGGGWMDVWVGRSEQPVQTR